MRPAPRGGASSHAGCVILRTMRAAVLVLLLSGALAIAQQSEADRLLSKAVEAQQRGDFSSAIDNYEKLLKLRPGMAEARVNLGAALAHTGRFDEAIAQYRQALPSAPDKSSVQMDIGLAYYKKGDLPSASREFQQVLREHPQDTQVAILLGDSLERSGRGPEALAMLAPLEAANTGNPDFEYVLGAALIQAGKRREGVARLEQTARATQSADAFLLAGSTLLDLNEYSQARTDLETALKLNPNLPRIYTLTGMARDNTGDQAAAEPAFREAVKVDPQDFDANLYLGAILYKRRAVDEARPYLEKALQLKPSSTMARYEVAMLKTTAGQYEDAAKELETVIQEDPNWLEPHVELATVYYRLHRPADGARERAIVDRITAEQQSKGVPKR
jgi:tetratricopeptide (TPR) repeat protein